MQISRTCRCALAAACVITALASCGSTADQASEPPSLKDEHVVVAVAPSDNEEASDVLGVAQASPNETHAAPTVQPTATQLQEGAAPRLPVTLVDELGNEVTITSIDRIIPLDGTVAEVVFALGLGDYVVATDLSATYPPQADALPEIGYQRSLTAESIASFAPTILLATDIAGPEEAIDDLRRLGMPLVIVPNEATPEGPAAKIRAVAIALGVPERGERLAQELEQALSEAAASPTANPPLIAAMYLRGASTQLVLGRNSATHWLIEAAGGTDIADALDIDESAPISAEALLVAAPDILLVPASGLASVGGIDGLLEIGGLSQTPAGRNRAVLVYDDQLLLGNGPRTGQLLAHMIADIREFATE